MVTVIASRGARARASRSPLGGSRAFTLVELMVTVAVVGVLAVLAGVSYRKYVASSRQTETNNILAGIKNRQEAYKAETGGYLNISPALAYNQDQNFATLYPHCLTGLAKPGAFKVDWHATAACPGSCCNAGTDWLKLKVETTAPTYYGYSTVSGTSGSPATTVGITFSGHAPTWPPSTSLDPWFIATAVGDPDGNGVFSTVMISSFDNAVYVDNDGE